MYVREVLCDHTAKKCFEEKWLGFFLKGGIKCLKTKQEIFGFWTGWIFFKSGYLKNMCSMFQACFKNHDNLSNKQESRKQI